MDTKKSIDEYKKEWFEKVERDSSNLFNVAENALKKSTDLQKVIIIKRLPRYDRSRDDILGIKAQLSEYDQLWVKRGCPANILITKLNGLNSSGYLRNIIFGETNNANYDGIHLRGPHAVRHFTYRAVQAVKSVIYPKNSARKKKNTEEKRQTSWG